MNNINLEKIMNELYHPQQYIFIWGNNKVAEMAIVVDLN